MEKQNIGIHERAGCQVPPIADWAKDQNSGAIQAATICSGGRYASPLNKTAQTMRAILLANAPVATCLRLRAVRLASHVLRPKDCFVLCSSTVCAPKAKSFRRYLFPRLLVPVSCCLPPVECSPGTTPNQAANPRPFLKAAPLPMAAMVAVADHRSNPG